MTKENTETKPPDPKEGETISTKVAETAPRVNALEKENGELSKRVRDNEILISQKESELSDLKLQNDKVIADLHKLKGIPSARPGFKTIFDEINEFIWGKE